MDDFFKFYFLIKGSDCEILGTSSLFPRPFLIGPGNEAKDLIIITTFHNKQRFR